MIVWIPAAILIAFLLLRAIAYRSDRDACPADVPDSPLGEAERILASRYARGTVTQEEYERMLAVLRR